MVVEEIKSLVKIKECSVKKEKEIDHFDIQATEFVYSTTIIVSNETDRNIEDDDYEVSVIESWVDVYEEVCSWGIETTKTKESERKTLKGNSIPAKGTATYTFFRSLYGTHHTASTDYNVHATINLTLQQPDLYHRYSGKEYEVYLSQKK